MSIQPGQPIDRDTLNRSYVSKSATGTQIMAGSLRLLGGITIDGSTTLGALTVGAISAGSSNITTTGAITAGTFSGSGASLTSLNATNLSSGTVADIRLSTNVALKNGANLFSGANTFQSEQKFHLGTWTDPHNGTSYSIKWAQGAAGNTLRLTGDATFLGDLSMLGSKKLAFDASGVAAPSDGSEGTKIQLYGTGKYNIGIDASTIWYDAYSYHRFYSNAGGTTRTLQFETNESGARSYSDLIVDRDLEVKGEIKSAGANEFPNPLIASESTSGWFVGSSGTISFDNVQAPSIPGVAGSIKSTATAADHWTESSTYFPVNPNEWITFSAYAFSTTASKAGQLFIIWYNSSNTSVGTSNYSISSVATSWTRYSLTGQAPATATKFRVRFDNDGGASSIMYFSAFQVERGRALTGFKPYSGGIAASFFDKGLKLGTDAEIHSSYNDNYIIKDHANGNVTLSAAGGNLYLGYQNTGNVFLSRPLTNNSSLNILGTDGTLYYKGTDVNTIYLRKDGGTMTGDLTIGKDNAWLTLDSNGSGANGVEQAAGISIGESGVKGSAAIHMTYTGDGYGHIGMGPVDAATSLPQYEAMRLYYMDNVIRFYAAPTVNGSTMWHAGNDGAGSGLDADVLDGMAPATANTASTIVQRDGSGNFSAGTITASLNGTATNISNTGTVTLASATESNSITITQPTYSTDKPIKLLNFNWYSDAWSIGNIRSGSTPSAGLGIFLNSVEKFRFVDGNFKVGTNNVWHQGNVGAGSGLTADTVDGKHSSDLMSSTVYREKQIVPVGGIAAGTAITIPNSRVYVTGSNRLQVFRDGILQELTDDYTEASTTSVAFLYDLPEDTRITFIINNAG